MLVVERGPSSRFLPGYVAFPGGAVDEGDEAHAERWFDDRDQAARAAAIRELVEEVGFALTANGIVAANDFDATDDAPPRADQLTPLCRWVAPPEVPVRFDARYFVAAVDTDLDPIPDRAEVAHSWWISPRRLLAEWERGERKLYWPSWFTVMHLSTCRSVDDVVALRFETREPTPAEEATMPRHVMEQV